MSGSKAWPVKSLLLTADVHQRAGQGEVGHSPECWDVHPRVKGKIPAMVAFIELGKPWKLSNHRLIELAGHLDIAQSSPVWYFPQDHTTS